eukprot:GDKI01002680.1.p2 GENE.GDKI01002680.1~~GDKI01002680.1.p2  ORF type:complete len:340 (-),score=92.60 GDKI01002680.1:237-1256(-)
MRVAARSVPSPPTANVATIMDAVAAFVEDAPGPHPLPTAASLEVDLLAYLPVGLCDDDVDFFETESPRAPVTLFAVLELCDSFAPASAPEGDRVVRVGSLEVSAPHTTDLALHYALDNPFEPSFALCRLSAPVGFDPAGLSVGGQTIFLEPNAGGNSVASEVLAFEALRCLLGAQLQRTEMQIGYWSWFSKKTDFSVSIQGDVYGVSVARCFDWRQAEAGTAVSREEAERLLVKKLDGVNKCNMEVCVQDRWTKQFLFLWVKSEQDAQVLHDVYVNCQRVAEVRGNTIVLVCVCADEFVYSNQGVHSSSVNVCRDASVDCASTFFDVSVFPFHTSVHVC